MTNGCLRRILKASLLSLLVMKPLNMWHLAHQVCTRIVAPLMVLHRFSPLSTFQTLRHYFQQLLCSRCPERHDSKSTQSGRFFFSLTLPEKIDCLSLSNVYSSSWMRISEGEKSEAYSNRRGELMSDRTPGDLVK